MSQLGINCVHRGPGSPFTTPRKCGDKMWVTSSDVWHLSRCRRVEIWDVCASTCMCVCVCV